MILFYCISGSTIFFAVILLLYMIGAGTTGFATSVLAFLDQHHLAILLTLISIALVGGVLLGWKRKMMIPGFAGLFAQFALGLFSGLYSVVENYHESAFLVIWSFVIYLMVMIIDLAFVSFVSKAALLNKNYILLYGGAIAGIFFHLSFW